MIPDIHGRGGEVLSQSRELGEVVVPAKWVCASFGSGQVSVISELNFPTVRR